MKIKHRDFLLKINVEELPASYVRPALDSLKKDLSAQLDSLRIAYGEVYTAGTASTLICYIKQLSLKQRYLSKEVIGPPKRVAFGINGRPAKQAIGFAMAQGVRIEELKIKSTPKGEYIAVEKNMPSRPTGDILKEILPDIIRGIRFPKTMKWDDSGIRFARPIDSIAVLLGRENISVKIGKVSHERITAVIPAAYLERLKKDCLIDVDGRKKKIKGLILKSAGTLKADQCVDENLLEEVNFMVSSPDVFVGRFGKRFLRLPEDVLKASMAKHQRVFPVSKKGLLVNRFIAVINGKGRDVDAIRRNYENILDAKLQDSLFFYDEDTKRPFSDNNIRLKDLIFQKGLGNMFEKILRLKTLCSFVCDESGLEASLKRDVERSAELSKADLLTHMVGEFPSLQGLMGGEYALEAGEKKIVATAIREHYLPYGVDGRVPGSVEGSILAVSDRMDNLVGFLGTGLEISGSFDPFGIRRNAQGLIRIIKERSLRFEIGKLIGKAIELYGNKLNVGPVLLKDRIMGYIKERIGFLMGEVRPAELKKAVLAAGSTDIVDAFKRFSALTAIKDKRYFLEAAKVVERTSNMLKAAKVKGEKIDEVDTALFKERLEQTVWEVYVASRDKINALIDREEYSEATREYGRTFFKLLHEFFDMVLVNVEDNALRLNRLAMIETINRLYAGRVADLALLPQIVVK